MKNKKKYIKQLENLQVNAEINEHLRMTISEIIIALKQGRLHLASDLSSVKRYIVSPLNTKGYLFRENDEENRKKLGGSVYSILDNFHHDISFELKQIPAGMTIINNGGFISRSEPVDTHPIIDLMNKEQRNCEARHQKI